MNLTYILNQLGEDRHAYFNAASPPVIQTSNFVFNTVAQMQQAFTDEKKYRLYTRGNNPTTEMLCKKIAALQGTEDCLVLSSGAAAISVAVLSQLKAGDHVICVEHPYNWAYQLFTAFLPRYGVTTTFVNGSDLKNFENALQPNTRLIYLESPTTMFFELQDLEAVCQLAKQKNILTIIDNSYCSPVGQHPEKYGVDLIIHSATKYINGHSDVVAGIICGSHAMIEKIYKNEFLNFGAISSPLNSWLMLRSLRTLPLRLKQSSESAQKIISFLAAHPKVERIYYPFHPSHPQYELAKKQMLMPMGMFSVVLKTSDRNTVVNFCETLKYFLMAVSWGGHESLIIPACAFADDSGYPVGFIRFYIGLEEADVLIGDLDNALKLI